MVVGHNAIHISAKVNNKMLLKRNNQILKTLTQVSHIKITEGVGNERETYELISYVFQVRMELRPIVAGKQRVTTHRVLVGEARYLTRQYPSSTLGKWTEAAEICERRRITGV